jgi:hypothetical protein
VPSSRQSPSPAPTTSPVIAVVPDPTPLRAGLARFGGPASRSSSRTTTRPTSTRRSSPSGRPAGHQAARPRQARPGPRAGARGQPRPRGRRLARLGAAASILLGSVSGYVLHHPPGAALVVHAEPVAAWPVPAASPGPADPPGRPSRVRPGGSARSPRSSRAAPRASRPGCRRAGRRRRRPRRP